MVLVLSEQARPEPVDTRGIGYSADMTQAKATQDEPGRVGLCFDCQHAQRIQSARGSTFYRCKLSDADPRFPKYPRLPILRCAGYAPKVPKS